MKMLLLVSLLFAAVAGHAVEPDSSATPRVDDILRRLNEACPRGENVPVGVLENSVEIVLAKSARKFRAEELVAELALLPANLSVFQVKEHFQVTVFDAMKLMENARDLSKPRPSSLIRVGDRDDSSEESDGYKNCVKEFLKDEFPHFYAPRKELNVPYHNKRSGEQIELYDKLSGERTFNDSWTSR